MAKVLITGMGAISPLGADLPTSFAQALAGHCAVGAATPEIAKWLPNVLLAQAAAEPAGLLDGKHAGLDRASQFALVAANEALAAANFGAEAADTRRVGVYVGIGFGGAHTVDGLYDRFQAAVHSDGKRNPVMVHPLSVPRMMANAPAAAISMGYGLRGPSHTYTVACASSSVAIGEAFRAIRDGYLDAAVVVGCEAMLTPGAMLAWNALRVMAKPHATDPARSCRPFSQDRSGFVLGEGGAAIVLESEARASARGQQALAELCGYGSSSDAAHLTAPSSAEQIHAMQQALDDAGLRPQDIQYLNAHGTATDAGDVTETASIRGVFGTAAEQLAVSSTKAMHGHLIGAGGILEFALSVLAMRSGSLPPTATLEQPDPRCDLDYIPLQARHGRDVRAIMSNSFAFGGSNVSLVAKRL
ncbi:beta-ketoacyl-[acyl-carrier-protein] synthase family protein [Vogesella sp. GCM10023246]|uniref:Nodulation protein E n=1 Tax=Vogesella oryzagri TaxID=3160864 RepID=A0ABV1M7G9_9NEIS